MRILIWILFYIVCYIMEDEGSFIICNNSMIKYFFIINFSSGFVFMNTNRGVMNIISLVDRIFHLRLFVI
jgi:bacteriorhodopsin